MTTDDFLRVFGSWKVEIKSSDGRVKEFKVKELYEMFNPPKAQILDRSYIKEHSQDCYKPF